MTHKSKILTLVLICAIGINTGFFYGNHVNSIDSYYQGRSEPKNAWVSDPLIEILSNEALDNFCAGNGTDGLTPATAHVIQDFYMDASGSGTVVFLENVTRYLIIQNCFIEMSGSSGTDAGIAIINGANIIIRNCVIRNNGRHGIYIQNSNSILIDASNISSNAQIGVYYTSTNNSMVMNSFISENAWEGIYYTVNCHNNAIQNNTLSSNRAGAYSYKSSTHLTITDNDIIDNDNEGIFLEDTSYSTISNNEVLGVSHSFGIYLELCTNNVVFNNTIFDVNSNGMVIYETNHTTVEANNVQRSGYYGFEMWGGDSGNYNTIENNNFSNNTNNGLILDDQCQHNQILNNLISDNDDYGVYFTDRAFNTTFSNNIMENNSAGLYVDRDSSHNMYSSNIFRENQDFAMYFETTHNNSVTKNVIENNYAGITLDSSHNNAIYGNAILNNEYEGLYIYDSQDNSIAGNNVSTNENGIFCDTAANNTIWMNFIGNNTRAVGVNGKDTTGENAWDNGVVGNYWSDYETLYPLAVANDNIWNMEYEISGNVNDTLPLVSATTFLEIVPGIDFKYGYGQTGNEIQWVVSGDMSILPQYQIYSGESLIQEGNWNTEAISLNVDGLTVGIYDFKIVVTDGTAWEEIEDVIQVEVGLLPGKPVFITTSQNIATQNLTVSWEVAAEADSYEIFIDEVFMANTEDTEMVVEFTTNGNYTIQVVAINAFGKSTPSNPILITVDNSSIDENRFDPFSDDPLRNVPGYPLWGFASLLLVAVAGLLWITQRQKRIVDRV
ncbi:MAG: NosD domain-containing protein [Promethearchaeota archaeon]